MKINPYYVHVPPQCSKRTEINSNWLLVTDCVLNNDFVQIFCYTFCSIIVNPPSTFPTAMPISTAVAKDNKFKGSDIRSKMPDMYQYERAFTLNFWIKFLYVRSMCYANFY